MQRCRHFLLQCVLQRCRHLPSAGRQRFTRGDLLEKEFFCFLFYYFTIFLSGTLFETTHEPSSLEEGTLAEDDSGLPCPIYAHVRRVSFMSFISARPYESC